MPKSKEEKEKELQRKYVQYQLMKSQLNSMLEEKMLLDQKVTEIMQTKQSVEQIKKVKDGQEIWSSLGSGSFIQANIKDTKNVAIELGAGVVVKKPVDEAMEILQKRLEEIVDIDNKLTIEINKLNKQINELEAQIQKLVQ